MASCVLLTNPAKFQTWDLGRVLPSDLQIVSPSCSLVFLCYTLKFRKSSIRSIEKERKLEIEDDRIKVR